LVLFLPLTLLQVIRTPRTNPFRAEHHIPSTRLKLLTTRMLGLNIASERT